MTHTLSRALGWSVAAAIIAGAAVLRLPRLDQRPMHGDEANQAVRTGLLLDQGFYHYDPADHHGPTLYFAAWPFCRVTARTFAETTEWNYRLVPVTFSLLTLLMMLGLGSRESGHGLFASRAGIYSAALLTAASPAMTYYSRFFIQESMLLTFLTGMLLCAMRYAAAHSSLEARGQRSEVSNQQPATRNQQPVTLLWAAGFGAFAGLAAATKETAVLSFAAAAVALVVACGFGRLWRMWRTRDALVAVGAAAFVAVLFYSSFFTYWCGVYDALFSTFQTYHTRATAVPEHQHPWDFYLKIIFWFKYGRGPVWSEAGLLLPAALAVGLAFLPFRRPSAVDAGTRTRRRWLRFLSVYTLALTALYSAIPYKTPWCALSFLHGFILLAGAGVDACWMACSRRTDTAGSESVFAPLRLCGKLAVVLLVAALVWRHAAQARRACFKMPADPRNPYVYAHTGSDAMNLVAEIERAARHAEGTDTLIALAVPTPDTWPLPWYLRKYRNVGYWTRVVDIPADLQPTVVVAAADQGDAADERFGRGKRASFFGIRPGVLLNLFVPEK
ncbi:MAG TPA: TIGR03663 family protein [Kiritimatiellia bacterium]|nr:TIGR03663 family protein [Kiritimatiellia bacterium]HRU69480.1 TIGR03663 family protein [Kiritimatiellia bacterium]